MRTLGVIAVASVLSLACNAPRVDLAAEAAALQARSEAVSAAEAAKDREKVLTFWAPDAIIQGAGTPQVQGREGIDRSYRQLFDSSGLKALSGKSSSVVVAASGDLAYETGVNRVTFGTPEGDVLDVGKYLAVWKKIDGTWYIAAVSATSDAPPPAGPK